MPFRFPGPRWRERLRTPRRCPPRGCGPVLATSPAAPGERPARRRVLRGSVRTSRSGRASAGESTAGAANAGASGTQLSAIAAMIARGRAAASPGGQDPHGNLSEGRGDSRRTTALQPDRTGSSLGGARATAWLRRGERQVLWRRVARGSYGAARDRHLGGDERRRRRRGSRCSRRRTSPAPAATRRRSASRSCAALAEAGIAPRAALGRRRRDGPGAVHGPAGRDRGGPRLRVRHRSPAASRRLPRRDRATAASRACSSRPTPAAAETPGACTTPA